MKDFYYESILLISYQRLVFIVIIRTEIAKEDLNDWPQQSFFTQNLQNSSQQLHSASPSPILPSLLPQTSQMAKKHPIVPRQTQGQYFDAQSKGNRELIEENSIDIDFAQYGFFDSLFGLTSFLFAYLRLLSLSDEDLKASTTIDTFEFIELFLKNYSKARDKLIHLSTSRTIPNFIETLSSDNATILEAIIYTPTSDPHIHIDTSKITSRKLLKWLEEITKMQVFEFSTRQDKDQLRSINKENPEENLLWFNSNTFHSLGYWLANQLERSLLRFYFNRLNRHAWIKSLKDFIQQNYMSQSFEEVMNISLKDIENGFLKQNQEKICRLRVAQQNWRKQHQLKLLTMNDDESKKPRKKKKKFRRFFSDEVLEKEVSIIHTQGSTTQDNYQWLQQPNIVIKQDKDNTDEIRQQPERMKAYPQISSSIKSISKSSEKTCDQLSEQQMEKLQEAVFKQEGFYENLEQQQLGQIHNLDEAEQKKKRRRRKNGKNTNKPIQQLKAKAIHKILNQQLDNLLDQLSMESNQKFDSKVMAFERIRYIVRSMYPYSDAVLFGSNAVGLSLPTSDIDIMLVGLPFSSRDELCFYLQQVENCISNMSWIVAYLSISQAKVPILKLQIDTRIPFFQHKMMNYQKQMANHMLCGLDLKNPAKGSIIKVDITISNDLNGVSPTTQLMRNEMQLNPSIQRILLALKYILSVKGFNQNFKGGIGSYCLFIMVAAYFHDFQQQRKESDCQILLDILKFFGQYFDNHRKTVHLSLESNQFFTDNDESGHLGEDGFMTPLRVVNPLNNTVINNNCYQYSLIKAEWRKIHEQIMSIHQAIGSQIDAILTSNLYEIPKLLTNQRSFEKWSNKVHSRLSVSVGAVISRHY